MRRLLSWVTRAPNLIRTMWLAVSPLRLKNRSLLLCTSSFQGDTICNGMHGKQALLSDPQQFEAQFDDLVKELSERDLVDPALADALTRLREVCVCVLSRVLPRHCCVETLSPPPSLSLRFWCTIPLVARGTGACL